MDALEKIEQLKAMAAADPEDSLTFFLLGTEQIHAQQFVEAASSLERAVALAPEHTASHRLLGDAWRKAGDALKARAAYERAVEVAQRTGDLQVAKEARVFLRRLGGESS